MQDIAIIVICGLLIGFSGVLYFMAEKKPAKPLLARIASGERFNVVLDSCPYKEKKWRGRDNLLGDIVCDATYGITYRDPYKE